MKKYNFLKKTIWIITILWMATIFYFSHQPAEISRKESGMVLAKMNILSEAEISIVGDSRISNLQCFVRKSAHIIVYLILGGLLTLSIAGIRYGKIKSYIIAYIIGALYGVSDEIHQYFIPGRGPMVRDVFIDSIGVIMGVFLAALLIEFIYMFQTTCIHRDSL